MFRDQSLIFAYKICFDVYQATCYEMAVVNLSLIIVSILLSYARANPTCTYETQCKLLLVGEDVVLKFQELAAEKGVRIIYLNTEIGDDSYHPLESNERFFAKRWVWANTISEPLLSLMEDKDDFFVHSFSLLEYQVRYLKVPLQDQPSGCLARLNTSCQNIVIAQTLLGNFLKVSSDKRLFKAVPTDCLCALHIVDSAERKDLKHVCCRVENLTELNSPRVRCELRAQSTWLQIFDGIKFLLTFILLYFSTASPLLLPDWLFNLQHEYEKDKSMKTQIRSSQVMSDNENNDEQQQTSNQVSTDHQHETEQSVDLEDETSEEDSYVGMVINPYGELLTVVSEDQKELDCKIPLDDTSPITFGALLSDYAKELPDFKINFNLKMLFLCFGVFPFFLYLKIALIIFHKMESYREFYQTFKNCSKEGIRDKIFCSAIAGFSSQIVEVHYFNAFSIVGCVLLFIILLSIRPKDLFYVEDDINVCFVPNCPSVSLGHEIIIHLKTLHHWAYDLTFFTLWKYMSALKGCLVGCVLRKITIQRRRRTCRSLCYVLSSLTGLLLGAVLGAICIVIFLVSLGILICLLSPLFTSYIFVLKKFVRMGRTFQSFNRVFSSLLLIVISTFCFAAALFFIFFILLVSAEFIVKTFLFTVMGLVLNAELITPYVAFTLVVTRNLYLCYSNLQSRYREVKDMIAKHWKESTEELPWPDNGNDETIPKELFWFVCGKGKSDFQKNILPLRAEICFMLRDMALILTFLSVSLFAILVFKSMNDLSALVSTIFVFVSGVIPSLVFQGFTKKEKFSGWDKIKIEKKIKEAVKEYINKKKEGALVGDCSGSFHWFQYHSDNEYDFG